MFPLKIEVSKTIGIYIVSAFVWASLEPLYERHRLCLPLARKLEIKISDIFGRIPYEVADMYCLLISQGLLKLLLVTSVMCSLRTAQFHTRDISTKYGL